MSLLPHHLSLTFCNSRSFSNQAQRQVRNRSHSNKMRRMLQRLILDASPLPITACHSSLPQEPDYLPFKGADATAARGTAAAAAAATMS